MAYSENMQCHRCVRPIQIGNDDYVENELEKKSHISIKTTVPYKDHICVAHSTYVPMFHGLFNGIF